MKKNVEYTDTIRKPKWAIAIFMFNGITGLFAFVSTFIIPTIYSEIKSVNSVLISEAIKTFLVAITPIILSIMLTKKRYDNSLVIATVLMLVPSVFSSFFILNPYLIIEIPFYVILILYTYVMVKMPDTSIRKTLSKIRAVIPVYQLFLIIFSVVQTRKELIKHLGEHLNESTEAASTIVPFITALLPGVLLTICYTSLVNWLSNPYEKK